MLKNDNLMKLFIYANYKLENSVIIKAHSTDERPYTELSKSIISSQLGEALMSYQLKIFRSIIKNFNMKERDQAFARIFKIMKPLLKKWIAHNPNK